MKALLCADGGVNVGLGHASRSSALWTALHRAGHDASVQVETASGLAAYLSRLGVPAVEASIDPVSINERAGRMNADLIVIDSYRWLPEDFLAIQKPGRPIVAFDDEARHTLAVSAIVNGAPAAANLIYKALPHTKLWLGPAYQVIREEFREVPVREPAGTLRRLIVLVGGDDPFGLLPELAARMNNLAALARPEFDVDLICGPYCGIPDTRGLKRVRVVLHPPDLREWMLAADIALSASGQTLFELARCGTPTVAFCAGEDQVHNLASLASSGVVWNVGRADQAGMLAAAEQAILTLAADVSGRDRMSACAQRLIDGRGADRLVVAMNQLSEAEKSSADRPGPHVIS
jgi:spore coat polysaccharide biosynthesis predicted glycosyltransferase SpsG